MRPLSLLSVACFFLTGLALTQTCSPPDYQNITRSSAPDRDMIFTIAAWSSPEITVHMGNLSQPAEQALIDTGAYASIVRESALVEAGLAHLMTPMLFEESTNWGVATHTAKLDVFLPRSKASNGDATTCLTSVNVIVLQHLHSHHDLILGTDFLGAQQATISYPDRQLTLGRCGGTRTELDLEGGWPEDDENRYWRVVKAQSMVMVNDITWFASKTVPRTAKALANSGVDVALNVRRVLLGSDGSEKLEELVTEEGRKVSMKVPWDKIVQLWTDSGESVLLAVQEDEG